MPPLSIFSARDAMMMAAATAIAEALRFGIATRGEACAALSGGTTPEPAYRTLAHMPLPWRDITLALVDERFLAPEDDASNEGLLRRTLATPIADGATVAPMFSAGSLEDAAARADAVYKTLQLDIAVMGMGADGHAASWFPGAPELGAALDLANPRNVMALHAPQAYGSPERLTLTRAALSRADRLLLLITGPEKRARLEANDGPVAALFDPQMPPCEILYAP